MNITAISATERGLERTVAVETDAPIPGSQEIIDERTNQPTGRHRTSYVFGAVQDKEGKWVAPDAAAVAREVRALLSQEQQKAAQAPAAAPAIAAALADLVAEAQP